MKFDLGDQRLAIICGDLALTSTRLPNGAVTAEIARRQSDGTWLWVIDQPAIAKARARIVFLQLRQFLKLARARPSGTTAIADRPTRLHAAAFFEIEGRVIAAFHQIVQIAG